MSSAPGRPPAALLVAWSNNPINGLPRGNVDAWLKHEINDGWVALTLGGGSSRRRNEPPGGRHPWRGMHGRWVFVTWRDPPTATELPASVALLAAFQVDDHGFRHRSGLVTEGMRREMLRDPDWVTRLQGQELTDVGGLLAAEAVQVRRVDVPERECRQLLRRAADGNERLLLRPEDRLSGWGLHVRNGVGLTEESRDLLLARWRHGDVAAASDALELRASAFRSGRVRQASRREAQELAGGGSYLRDELVSLLGSAPSRDRETLHDLGNHRALVVPRDRISHRRRGAGVVTVVRCAMPPARRLGVDPDTGSPTALEDGWRAVLLVNEGTSCTSQGEVLYVGHTNVGNELRLEFLHPEGATGDPGMGNEDAGVVDPHESPPQERITLIRRRDARVRRCVLDQADGVCEACERPAPFRTPAAKPYLEVHHVRALSDGGIDAATNAVAICPNCHREAHFGDGANTLNESLADRARTRALDVG